MSELTSKTRNALPDRIFALPSQRKYPLDTHNRQVNAKGRATQAVKAGRMSPATADKIKAKAKAIT